MRYTGLRGKEFYGDKAKAQSLQRAADLLVGRVIKRLKAAPFNGTGYLIDRQELNDGSWIGCMVNMIGGNPIIRTWIDSPIKENRENEFLSGLYYMDSGFVLPMDTYGRIWQDAATIGLYKNYEKDPLKLFLPKTGVGGGAQPPSFVETSTTAYEEKRDIARAQAPGNYTGKLRWLVAGQYGLDLTDPYWIDRDNFQRAEVMSARRSGEGIFTSDQNTFWYLRIEEAGSGLTGTAELLESPLKAFTVPSSGTLSEPLRQFETHALAIAKKTGTIWPVVFTGDALDAGITAKPFGYGWHFNESGRKAAIVLHRNIGGIDTSNPTTLPLIWIKYVTSVYEATITKNDDDESFTFSISKLSETTWDVPLFVGISSPVFVYPNYAQNSFISPTSGGPSGPIGPVPLHCYYDPQDDTLQKYQFSYNIVDLPGTHPPCGDTHIIDKWTGAAHDYIADGVEYQYSLSRGTDVCTTRNRPSRFGRWNVSAEFTTTDNVNSITSVWGDWCIATGDIPVIGPCGEYTGETLFFGTPMGEHQPVYYYTKVVTTRKITNYSVHYDEGAYDYIVSGCTLIVPVGDADCMMMISQEIDARYSDHHHEYLGSGTGLEPFEQVSVSFSPMGTPCSCQDYDTGMLYRQGYGVSNGAPIDITYHEDVQIARSYMGVFTPDKYVKVQLGEEEIDWISDSTWYEATFTNGSWGDFVPTLPYAFATFPGKVEISRGLTGAFRWTDGIGAHYENGYPELATLQIGWS